jgi:hypothetical protein
MKTLKDFGYNAFVELVENFFEANKEYFHLWEDEDCDTDELMAVACYKDSIVDQPQLPVLDFSDPKTATLFNQTITRLVEEQEYGPTYYYFIDMDERGEFRASVRTHNDTTKYQIEGLEVFEDGVMRHKKDFAGLHRHLVRLEVLPEPSRMVSGQ